MGDIVLKLLDFFSIYNAFKNRSYLANILDEVFIENDLRIINKLIRIGLKK